jgi:hypothetical protein
LYLKAQKTRPNIPAPKKLRVNAPGGDNESGSDEESQEEHQENDSDDDDDDDEEEEEAQRLFFFSHTSSCTSPSILGCFCKPKMHCIYELYGSICMVRLLATCISPLPFRKSGRRRI